MTNMQIIILVAVLIALALVWFFWMRRGQAVDMRDADKPLAPTLQRERPAPLAAPLPPATTPLPPVAPLAPAATTGSDDLRQLKGVGPRLAVRLGELGVTRFDQLAALDADGVAALDAQLGTFQGRIVRDNWVEQAGLLAKGDVGAFEARFGKLDSEN